METIGAVAGIILAVVSLITAIFTWLTRVSRSAYNETIETLSKQNCALIERIEKAERANDALRRKLENKETELDRQFSEMADRINELERQNREWREGAMLLFRQVRDEAKLTPAWTPPAELIETPAPVTRRNGGGPRSPLGGRQ